MFNMGLQEMIVLGAIALLVIGPKQLPEVARVVGRMLNEFKRATGDLTSSIANVKNEAQTLANSTESFMHKQKAEFEKKMREDLELDREEAEESSLEDSQSSQLKNRGVHQPEQNAQETSAATRNKSEEEPS